MMLYCYLSALQSSAMVIVRNALQCVTVKYAQPGSKLVRDLYSAKVSIENQGALQGPLGDKMG